MVEKLKQLSLYIFLALLAYVPLHIFLSTWVGTSFDVLPVAKVAKDVVLVVGFLAALIASVNQPWFKALIKDKLVWLILAYFALTLLLALIKPTDQDAEVLGVVYNTRFLLFFLYGILLSNLFDAKTLRRKALKIVLTTATAVLFFGIIQYTILPNDALTHVGYSRANGVLPAFFIDDKPDLERAMSTLRDPNSFGSYVIITGTLGLALYFRKKIPKQSALGLIVLSSLCLLFTFSRSAWIGFILTGVTLFVLLYRERVPDRRIKQVAGTLLVLLVLGVVALYPLRNTYFVQNIIFHADESTVLENPNELRARFWEESVNEVVNEPLGHGPGTAGLVSIRNNVQGTKLNENYYLQIAHEVGLIGLALFMVIIVLVGYRLFQASGQSTLALALLAGFAGLVLTNFLVHIWSNEAVAYTWWGLAGLFVPYKKRS